MKIHRLSVSIIRTSVFLMILFLLALSLGALYTANFAADRYSGRPDIMWKVTCTIFILEIGVSAYCFKRNLDMVRDGWSRWQSAHNFRLMIMYGVAVGLGAFIALYGSEIPTISRPLVVMLIIGMALGIWIFMSKTIEELATSNFSIRVYKWLTAKNLVYDNIFDSEPSQ